MSVSRHSIRIIVEGVGEAEGELTRVTAPLTVEGITKILPVSGRTSIWKDAEVYFNVPFKAGSEKPVKEAKKGAIAYWPLGGAICIFYEDLVPYSPVNLIGRVIKGLEIFSQVRNGMAIRLERLSG